MKKNRRAQNFMEYTILISIVAMAVSALVPMLRRGSQSLLKAGADQIADQMSGEQDFESAGYMRGQNTQTQTYVNKQKADLDSVLSEKEAENIVSQTKTIYQLSGDE